MKACVSDMCGHGRTDYNTRYFDSLCYSVHVLEFDPINLILNTDECANRATGCTHHAPASNFYGRSERHRAITHMTQREMCLSNLTFVVPNMLANTGRMTWYGGKRWQSSTSR